jgi:periplasmic divalent cation tolerance protein
LQAKLIACCNIIPSIRSMYWWKGEISDDNESLMIIKTVKNHCQKIIELVKNNHSYEVPEVVIYEYTMS